MLIAIVACEVGFWIVLAAGLLLRYGLRRPRSGGALLLAVPLIDVVLLALTAVDLQSGAEPDLTHGLAALYLGFSIAFGHDVVRWADVRVARRFAGGPRPAGPPSSGSPARVRKEWRDFGLAVLAVVISTAVLVGLAAATAPGVDDGPLLGFLPKLAFVLLIWLLGWPVVETVRMAMKPDRRGDDPGDHGGARQEGAEHLSR